MILFAKRELRRLRRQLDSIIITDTNAQLTTATSDKDVAALTASVNAMLERNRQALFEIERAEATLKRAITNISHDLRTPLTSALGYLQLLESSDLDNDTRGRYLSIVKGRLESLSELMNSLFEFAQVIESDTEYTIQEINICNILRDIVSEFYPELERKGFAVEVDIPSKPQLRMCNEDALRRILQNLLKNVCTHGREYLRVGLTDGAIEIANKAHNLKELDMERLFERFYTADASRTSKNTGLGLAIAKELAERTGTRITAQVSGELLVMCLVL